MTAAQTIGIQALPGGSDSERYAGVALGVECAWPVPPVALQRADGSHQPHAEPTSPDQGETVRL
jgi:hypothetical protein